EMHPKIGFCLKARSARTGRETHFGAVQALPDGVAYHLFPLYGHPELLENVTPRLFNKLRGKTCFHFDDLDAGLGAGLAQRPRAGLERSLADGVLYLRARAGAVGPRVSGTATGSTLGRAGARSRRARARSWPCASCAGTRACRRIRRRSRRGARARAVG